MRKPKDIKIGSYTLEEILERHKHWLNKDCVKWEYMRADLSWAYLHCTDLSCANLNCANLSCANLSGANLSSAYLHCTDLSSTDLSGANLRGANLRDADLSCANLSCANLSGANLSSANLSSAYLHCTDLSSTDLSSADFRGADLRDANLSGTDLRDADLSGANLSGTDLSCTNLSGANLTGANLINTKLSFNDRLRKGIKLSEPIIGWKKCKNNVLVKLEIPRGAIVFSINNKKCRTDKAKVLDIIGADEAYSRDNEYFSYHVGDIIEIFDFNCEYNIECANGIHFFRTKEEAEKY